MDHHTFDDSQIDWRQLEGIEHLHYHILDVDADQQIVDVLLKFEANERIILHRHTALNHMLVIQGEHRLYEPDGSLKEVRPTGCYTVSPASEEPHCEGGGDQDVVILFSIRGTDGTMYEFLDDAQNVVGSFGMNDFKALYDGAAAA
ncbi:MAG: quercetin dioxygenase-like cupin family protein [Glaciecola sp.]|jgi:quercetin dioxygenase-like cupin family protein|uniref:cupin domain-containing protein n=1 Tax=Congregibacter sp. TaxID=2744308 RepID=UPI0039E2E65D